PNRVVPMWAPMRPQLPPPIMNRYSRPSCIVKPPNRAVHTCREPRAYSRRGKALSLRAVQKVLLLWFGQDALQLGQRVAQLLLVVALVELHVELHKLDSRRLEPLDLLRGLRARDQVRVHRRRREEHVLPRTAQQVVDPQLRRAGMCRVLRY